MDDVLQPVFALKGVHLKKTYIGILLIILSALGFSFLPLFALYAYKSGITVPTLLLIRFFTAAVLFFIYIFFFVKHPVLTFKNILHFILLGGVCYTLQSTFYFNSVKYISPSLAVLILYTFPVFVAVLSFIFFKESLNKKTILSIVLSFSGLVVITAAGTGNINITGVISGLLAAVTYSAYIVLGSHVIKHMPSIVTSAWVTLFATLGILVTGLPNGEINFAFNPAALLPAAGIALFSTVLAIFTFFKGLEYLSPTKASILSMLEPVFTIILTALLLNGFMNLFQLAGGVIVLAGAALTILMQKPVEKEGRS